MASTMLYNSRCFWENQEYSGTVQSCLVVASPEKAALESNQIAKVNRLEINQWIFNILNGFKLKIPVAEVLNEINE